ncbi:MAG: lysine--tRNA ligase [Deltaproteobacteria bacterium]|nr:lysine--tRNA ligase [Deltaproteobacteria bacterium]
MEDTNRVREDRLKKLEAMRDAGIDPFTNGWTPGATLAALVDKAKGAALPAMDAIGPDDAVYAVAGRVMARNAMGKAQFLRLRDRTVGLDEADPVQAFQIYARADRLDERSWDIVKRHLDVGDIVGVRGRLFVTKTGEPTLMADEVVLLTKSLRPLPDKWHGLSDQETRFRQRYVDLVVNPAARAVFRARSLVIDTIRDFLRARDFIEVETPMMQVIPGGAAARPFVTHHNALDIDLYLRIAPELYLKRLLVGGLERVFELNRNFRNEGLSLKHNPEFTMLEFYQAYATFEDLIVLTEAMLSEVASRLADAERRPAQTDDGPGRLVRRYGEHDVDWSRPWRRYTVKESLVAVGGLTEADVESVASLTAALAARNVALPAHHAHTYGHLLVAAFEALVEKRLIQPTFITHYPVENSPLARRNDRDPTVTDRFELFVAGNEIANAFSELNDPIDQKARFEAQVAARAGGDDEAMYMDLDYVRALEYAMPPAAGEGIGIDRLVMLMTGQQSIREVIFFPHMRPE